MLKNETYSDPKIYTVLLNPYELNVDARVSALSGGIFLHKFYDEQAISSAYVEISGKRYPCTITTSSYNNYEKSAFPEYSGDELYPDHSIKYRLQCSYPKVQPGTKAKIVLTDSYGHVTSKDIKIKNTPSKLTVSKITSSTTKVTGHTSADPGSRIEAETGKKLKSSKKRQTVTISLSQKAAAGSTVTAVVYDKFNRKKGADKDSVYIGNSIYVGMSANDALLTTWGYPIRKNDWGNGYRNGCSTAATVIFTYI